MRRLWRIGVCWLLIAHLVQAQEEGPAAPTLSLASPQRRLVLTWRQTVPTVPIERYAVYKAPVGGAWVLVALVDGLLRGWEDTAVTGGETLRYSVIALGAGGTEAERSNVVRVTVP